MSCALWARWRLRERWAGDGIGVDDGAWDFGLHWGLGWQEGMKMTNWRESLGEEEGGIGARLVSVRVEKERWDWEINIILMGGRIKNNICVLPLNYSSQPSLAMLYNWEAKNFG